MKKLILKFFGLFSRPKKSQAVQDLLDNDHHYCKYCGDLFYSINPKQLYCSKACKITFNNQKRKR